MTKTKFQKAFVCIALTFLFALLPETIYGQQAESTKKTISGTIVDEKNEPLVGVTVVIKGTTNGTVSDLDGAYSLSCDEGNTLTFTYVGYLSQEVKVGGQPKVNIVLKENQKLLDEVVVIGYGTAIRKNVIGAVDQVQKKVLEDRPVANLTQALQGAAANLTIQQRSMNPNDNKMSITIRGISTMNNTNPLVVIDGLVSDAGSMNKLNPNDIETVSVLKDAGSAAIYGSRSGSGVILITTKQGKKNEAPKVRFNGSFGVQDPKMLFSPVKGYQNATLKNIALANTGLAPEFTPAQIEDLANHTDAEWGADLIFKPGTQQSYNLSVMGGSNNTTYAVSGAYFNQRSNFAGPSASLGVGTDYGIQRYNVRANISTEYKRFKLTQILAYSREEGLADQANGEFTLADSYRIPTYYYYALKANGKYIRNDILGAGNPLGQLEGQGYAKSDNDFVNTNTAIELSIIDGLKVKGIFGADLISDHRFSRKFDVEYYDFKNLDTNPIMSSTNTPVEDYNQKIWLTNMQALIDYNKTFGLHKLTGLFGVSQESYTRRANDVKIQYTDELGLVDSENVAYKGTGSTIDNTSRKSIQSIFGRVGYSFADKYYGEVSLRYDGSSKFPKHNRWGVFPSFSGGWRASEENFMKEYKSTFGDLKLRASYGILGNQEVGEYQYLTTFDVHPNQYAFGGGKEGSVVSATGFNYANTEITWEKMGTFNIGADMTFLNNKLSVMVDYFDKRTSDILVRPIVPSVFGTKLKDYNMGQMTNRGWELTVNYRLETGQLSQTFGINLSDSWNKVTKYEGFQEINPMDNQMNRITREGLAFNSYYGYKVDGLFKSQDEINNSALPTGITNVKPGDIKFVDRNNDGVIDDKDRYDLGYAFPRYTFGITYNAEYKGFDFNLLAQGVGKRDMALRGELMEPFHGGYSFAIYKHQLDTWSPTNTEAKYPRLTTAGSTSYTNNYGRASNYFLLDGAYLRLKNIQLGYTVPQSLSSRLGVGKVRAYVNAQNLFTLSKNSFIDPENSEFGKGNGMEADGGNSGRNYPTIKYYGFGIDIEF